MEQPNKKLQAYLDKRISQPTVILCFRIVLEHVINNDIHSGMTKAEIAKIFNRDNKKFGIQNFKTDYILRQTGVGDENAIYEDSGHFYIQPSFLKSLDKEDMKQVVKFIDARYSDIEVIRKQLIQEISSARKLSVDKKKEFIQNMLLTRETEKKGQAFEVTAFAILKVYFSIRGFELNRFSTIYSNDGGIDYVSQTSIYQVTNLMNDLKFEEDITKAPLKKRIFVYRRIAPGFDLERMQNDLVSDYISSDDLLNHLEYLLNKKPEVNASTIVQVMLNEFEREYHF